MNREAFEKWASDDGFAPQAVERSGGDGYARVQTQALWNCWQAAETALRASMPVRAIEFAIDALNHNADHAEYLIQELPEQQRAGSLQHAYSKDMRIQAKALEALLPPSSKEPI